MYMTVLWLLEGAFQPISSSENESIIKVYMMLLAMDACKLLILPFPP